MTPDLIYDFPVNTIADIAMSNLASIWSLVDGGGPDRAVGSLRGQSGTTQPNMENERLYVYIFIVAEAMNLL